MLRSISYAFLAVLLIVGFALAQTDSVFTITQLTDQIYQLSTDEGDYTTNVLLMTGPEGILLVDANTKANAEELKKVVESFGKGEPKYIINTHRHVEHIGGNAIFGSDPIIYGHYLIPKKLKSGSYIFNEFPPETYPDSLISQPTTLTFNGEKIDLIPMGGSHDDNEIIVHFEKNKIVHLSSLINGMNFPSIDSDGDLFQFAPLVKKAIEILPDDVTIISGHNGHATYNDLSKYVEMIEGSIARVDQGLKEGKTVKQMQEEDLMAGYEDFERSYVSKSDWIEYIADAFENKDKPKKETLFEPLYYAIKDGGAEKAIKVYEEINAGQDEKYNTEVFQMLVVGLKLIDKENKDNAVRLIQYYLTKEPGGQYAYYAHYVLGNTFKDQGQKEKAIDAYKAALKAKPDFGAAQTKLDELEK